MGDNRLNEISDENLETDIAINSTRGVIGNLLMGDNPLNSTNASGVSESGEDPLSNNILYIIIAVAVVVFFLSLLFILTKILKCHCLACLSSNRYSSSPNSVAMSGSKRGKHQRSSKIPGPAGLLEEDPIRGLIVPDIKIIDEDGNIIPRASFS